MRCYLLLLLMLSAHADAQFGQRGRFGGQGLPERERPGPPDFVARATGLQPRFPDGVTCPGISSPYGSRTRHDGSPRPPDINGGTHGGMDISLNEGTPLLAVADGEVLHAGSGAQMEGHYLWLRLSPASTGLPFWTFVKYQHLAEPSLLAIGTKVKRGEAVARGGSSGTTGGHYGSEGYAHLHLSTFYGAVEAYEIVGLRRNRVRGQGAVSGDPMLLYHGKVESLADVQTLDLPGQAVPVGVITPEGRPLPEKARTVWPLACDRVR